MDKITNHINVDNIKKSIFSISIITVSYNNLAGLKTTLKSAQDQEGVEFEHIIIDGNSNDGTKEYLETITDRVDYWVSEPDTGVYHAMNKGIEVATGDYLLFLNAGDHFYSKDALAKAGLYLGKEQIVYFNLEVIENQSSMIKSYPETLSFSYFVEDTLPHPATFINRKLFELVGNYKEDFKILSDWKFFIDAICKHRCTYKNVNITLSTFYIGGISSDPKNFELKNKERYQVLEQDYAVYLKDVQDVIKYKRIITTFKKSRIISLLTKFGFLNKF